MRARSTTVAALTALAFGVLLASPSTALAREPSSVTLTASTNAVVFGDSVTLTTTVVPTAAGQDVSILDAAGATLASGATDQHGMFDARVTPRANLVAHASSGGVDSPTVAVGVRPIVTVHAGAVRLFDDVKVTGTFHPVRQGMNVTVELQHNGHVIATARAPMDAHGRFHAALRVTQPGGVRARAELDAADLLPGHASAPAGVTPLPDLASGAHGVFVNLLERRLAELHYHLVGIDDVFDYRTADAVMAFRKVQRLPRTQDVNAAVWHALAEPKLFVPRSRATGFHIEVDQTRQVLATVQDGEVQAIFHVSTGKASTPTRDGTFHVYSKLAGFSPKGLYYPSFFDGERAIHGWTDVPNYPASHGCVRVPYWIATWIFGLDPIGTPVIIYH